MVYCLLDVVQLVLSTHTHTFHLNTDAHTLTTHYCFPPDHIKIYFLNRYWSSLTVIYGEQDNKKLQQAGLDKAKQHRKARLEMKWQEVLYLHKVRV